MTNNLYLWEEEGRKCGRTGYCGQTYAENSSLPSGLHSYLPRLISNVTRFYGNQAVTGFPTAIRKTLIFLEVEL